MATLDNNHVVHVSRIVKEKDGIEKVDGIRVKNRWIKTEENDAASGPGRKAKRQNT
jgi:hypothetical protein